MARPLAPHGSKGAYERHKRAHDRVCDACQAWKDGFDRDRAPANAKPERPLRLDDVDFVKETLSSLKLVRAALLKAPTSQISSLTKRKSELLKELQAYEAEADPVEAAPDPLAAALAGGGLAHVTPISA